MTVAAWDLGLNHPAEAGFPRQGCGRVGAPGPCFVWPHRGHIQHVHASPPPPGPECPVQPEGQQARMPGGSRALGGHLQENDGKSVSRPIACPQVLPQVRTLGRAGTVTGADGHRRPASGGGRRGPGRPKPSSGAANARCSASRPALGVEGARWLLGACQAQVRSHDECGVRALGWRLP